MAAAFFYSSVAVPNSIVSTINGAATTATLASAPSGYPAQYPFKAVLDPGTPVEEIVYVTNITGVTVTMERGKEGTAAGTHNGGAVFQHMITGEDLQRSRDHEDAVAAHGATGAVVGTTNTQSLTNKTLDATNAVAKAAVTGAPAGAFVGTTDAQALTNKTIDGDLNTLQDIAQSSVTNLVTDQATQNSRLTAAEGELDQFIGAGVVHAAPGDAATTFPLGLSVWTVSSGDGWPISGLMVVLRYTTAPARVTQEIIEAVTTSVRERRRFRHWDGTAWTAWEGDDLLTPAQHENATDVGIAANDTYNDEGASNRAQLVFEAPPSGTITITAFFVFALELSAANLRAMYGSFEVRTGGTVGSGTQVLAPDDNRAVQLRSDTAGEALSIGADVSYVLSGLTPGDTYNIRTMTRVSATGSFTQAASAHKRLIITPSP